MAKNHPLPRSRHRHLGQALLVFVSVDPHLALFSEMISILWVSNGSDECVMDAMNAMNAIL
jgi:hypothetical protein